jgi:hypothetical protein
MGLTYRPNALRNPSQSVHPHSDKLIRYAASVVMCIAYGRRIDSMNAKVMHGVNDAMEFVGSLNVPGAYLVETFPLLKHLPSLLAPWKRQVEMRSKLDAEFFGNLAMEVKSREEAGHDVPDCFVKSLIKVPCCVCGGEG